LEHLHSFGIVHRDVKPANILACLDDPSRLKLIDFGIAKPFQRSGSPTQYDPIKEDRIIVGTLHWASLNSHRGVDLSRRDDLESLAYVGLFLLRGDLPWRAEHTESKAYLYEGEKHAMMRIHAAKEACKGSVLVRAGFPEIGGFLDYSRSLGFCETPDYRTWRQRFATLAQRSGCRSSSEPLDWTPCDVERIKSVMPTDRTPPRPDDAAGPSGPRDPAYTNSYYAIDPWGGIEYWDDRQYERDNDLTLPAGYDAKRLDACLPSIVIHPEPRP
ncbi:kinase-like protein, partial [Punctularia strigosozonata HHB-11173 SS5]|uniref:kinase-like protein n=1 Tax=Punctularia strigosozonata (strain HHB-11173) TaxID=741275 RepID=UPI0004416B1A